MNMTTPTREEEVRQQFEAWFSGSDCSVPDIYRAEALESWQAALRSPAVAGLVEKVGAVLRHRVGELPNLGYIRDNDLSRKAIAELVAALAPFTTGAGHVE